jgi:hypothetical protein
LDLSTVLSSRFSVLGEKPRREGGICPEFGAIGLSIPVRRDQLRQSIPAKGFTRPGIETLPLFLDIKERGAIGLTYCLIVT